MNIRLIVALWGAAFAVALAVVVGLRLSTEAMAVVAGVMAGVAASVPASLITAWVATRQLGMGRTPQPGSAPPSESPRIVVVHSPSPPPAPVPAADTLHVQMPAPPGGSPWSPRHFTGLEPPPFPASADSAPLPERKVHVIGGLE
jgi:hypothetical protein